MKRKRHSPEQIIEKLRQAEADLAMGLPVDQVCRKLEISAATFHRWRSQYGGMKGPEVKRLRELERENGRLKRLLADQVLDNAILKEALSGKY